MAPVKNGRLLFNEIPEGFPEPGKTTVYDESETIDLDNVPLKGGFLVKTLVLSNDPYLRFNMRDPKVESYSEAFHIGKPIVNFGVGLVLRSESKEVKKGDHVYGLFPFSEYFVQEKFDGFRVLENKEGLPWSVYVGVAGMPGQTAFLAWKEFAQAKKGETAFVTAASGPVGSFVCQLAKADGLKVIASAGTDEKCDFVKSLGVDVVFNYKKTKTADVLAKEGPVDVYWDNVAGESLDAALENAAKHARFLECGAITGYNGEGAPVKNMVNVFAKEIHLYGFLVFTLLEDHADEFYAEVPARIAKGEFKYIEDIKKGLKWAGHAIYEVQAGKNHGKSIIEVATE
ncbi:NADP-dependent oxidoreductase [Phanerochaete sordida]|uniref:NADP-dependent oxidoreductase n=1 Tax=Phanerochaete sordida TaxID=48140 RepID=A0A9P3LEN7_9APHY|nr:NADP-dependent oxidoreductase [Phanerochaete sordida]